MNKSKKFTKIDEDIEQEVSDDMSNGNPKEEEDLYERTKKKHKQKSKPSKSRKKKKSNKRKKHRHVSESGTGSSSSAVSNTSKSSITSRSSESDVTKKRKKMKVNSDENRVIKIKSEVTKEPSEKFCSKWESPPRKRQRSQERLRDESRDHYRGCRDDRERQERCVRGEYRSEKARESQHYGRQQHQQQRSRSPRRSNEKSYDRHYIKRENNSPTSRSRDQSYVYQTKSKREVEKIYDWGKSNESRKPSNSRKETIEDKEKPNFALSGALTEDTNKVNGVVIKYSEPPEARKPKRRWRLYPFKGETALPVLHIHRQSCFLVGRDRKVADLAVDHPSCSKQHAALQYRLIPFTREDGSTGKRVRLYLIDLDSANGTFVNNKPIEARKYYELFEKDVIKFGFSTREYVLLHENSKEDQEDDDIPLIDEQPSK